jgi:hypothetical protein
LLDDEDDEDDDLPAVSSSSVISLIYLENVVTQISEVLPSLHLGLDSFEPDIIPWKDHVTWLTANTNSVHFYVFLTLPHREYELPWTLIDYTSIYQVN